MLSVRISGDPTLDVVSASEKRIRDNRPVIHGKVVNMILTKRHIANESAKMFADVIRMATSRRDGRKHDVTVILSDWSDYLFGHRIFRNQWLSATVDDERVLGGKLGVGNQYVLHKCTIFSPTKEGSNVR